MTPNRPILFFAFANDQAGSLALGKEERLIREYLIPLHNDNKIDYRSIGQTILQDIYTTFNQSSNNIYIFHYGGHSTDQLLQLSGDNAQADQLAILLGASQNLQLVFLNGCANEAQVQALLDNGVPAVIATNRPIVDTQATQFAQYFYAGLAGGRTIEQAFQVAVSQHNHQEQRVNIQFRGLDLKLNEERPFPWGLYASNKQALDWDINKIQSYSTKIPKFLGPPPFQPEVFLGRAKDLDAIHQQLFSESKLLLLVNGEGGIGKTSLAAAYYETYQNEYAHLAWIFAGTNIQEALLSLSIPLQLSYPEGMPNKERIKLLLQALRNLRKPSLLVIDNANDLIELENNYLALSSCTNLHIILTSRINHFEKMACFDVTHLDRKDAITLFKTYHPKHQPEEDYLLDDFFAAVNFNTLVVELLAKNLANFNRLRSTYTLTDLINDLQGKGLLALSQSKAVRVRYQSTGSSLRKEKPEAIIGAMYDLGNLSQELVQLLSLFSVLPAEYIPYNNLEALVAKPNLIEDQLLSLAQLGWIDFNEEDSAFKISPVIQEVIQLKNATFFSDCQPSMDKLIELLDYEGAIGHLVNLTYAKGTVFVRYGEYLLNTLNELSHDLAILTERIGTFHKATGDLEKALQYYVQYNTLKKELYEAYPENVSFKNGLAISYQNLGNTQTSLGDLEKALQYYVQYNTLEKELYEAYPENVSFKNGLAISYSKLGATQTSLGDLEKALQYYVQYNTLKKELYEAYPENVSFKNGLAISYSKLGETYESLGDLKKALQYYVQYNTLKKELYEAYPENVSFKNGLAISYSKLGETYESLGDLKKALQYYVQYNTLKKELYEAYPENVSFKNGLAISYFKLGQLYTRHLNANEKGKNYYQKAKAIWKELAAQFPRYVEFKRNLGVVNNRLNDL